MAPVIIGVVCGILMVIMGYLIWVKKMLFLIAGYHPDTVKDEAGLATFIGVYLILLGAVTILVPFLHLAFGGLIFETYGILILVSAIVVVGVRYIKYTR